MSLTRIMLADVPAVASVILALSGARLAAQPAATVPWAPGERLEYVMRFAGFKAGTGIMEVAGIDTLRDRSAWLLHFNITGSALGFHINDTYRSWMDVESLNSLRFDQDLLDAGKHTGSGTDP